MNQFILVRHSYDDHSYIDGKNDTSLTKKGIMIAQKESIKILTEVNHNKVVIRTSTKKRAQETAKIINDTLIENEFNSHIIKDYNFNELYQGKFNFLNLSHDERVNFLQSCWDDFEEKRLNGNLNWQFGHLHNPNIVLIPGEDHCQWSIRLAKGLLEVIKDLENNREPICITHRGSILELQQIVRMCNDEIEISDIEKYKTIWMEYCQDYVIQIEDLEKAKSKIKKYINLRSHYEDNN